MSKKKPEGQRITPKMSRDERLELSFLKTQLGKKAKDMQQETVDEIAKLVEEPDYGPEFLEVYVDYFNVLDKGKWSMPYYMNAMKFFVLIEGGHAAVNAYIKVFPERLASRIARGGRKEEMGGEASRYNKSSLVNEIRKVSAIGIQLSHRHLLHEALDVQANLMRGARSELVRQKASETLIRELKPQEDTKIQLDVAVNERDTLDSLRDATEKLVLAQEQSIKAGLAVKFIAEAKIIEAVIEDVE